VTWLDVSATGSLWPTDGVCRVRVTLRNDHGRETSEVVQVYLHDPVAEVARPERQLIAARRVSLAPGETSVLEIGLHADLTSYTGRAGKRLVEPGDVELRVGTSSEQIVTTLHCTLTGPRREVGFDRVLTPEFSS
jgi:beta-glucosidase